MKPNGKRQSRAPKKDAAGGLSKYLPFILKASAFGLLVTAFLLLLFSFVMSRVNLSFALINPLSTLSLVAGCFAAGLFAGRSIRENGILVGGVCGLLVSLFLLLAALGYSPQVGIPALLKTVIAVLSGAVGGVLGVNMRVKGKK